MCPQLKIEVQGTSDSALIDSDMKVASERLLPVEQCGNANISKIVIVFHEHFVK
jgi:hypothetical protein